MVISDHEHPRFKNKKGLDGKSWNHKFVIFDILVYENDYMSGSTFKSRVDLLDEIFGTEDYNEYLYKPWY